MFKILNHNLTHCESRTPTLESKTELPKSMVDIVEKKVSMLAYDKPLEILSEPGTYYGFTAGACTGFALKKIAKAAALTFGTVFVGFQLAAQSGYVSVDWAKVESDARKYLPQKSESEIMNGTVKFLITNTGIAATVFTAGFIAGLRMG